MVLYSAKLSFKIDGAIKIFHNKQKVKQYMTPKSPPQKILQGILHTEDQSRKNTRGWAVSNHRRKDKESESGIDSAAHNQILKQQKQVNGRNHHIPININTECQLTQLPIKRHHLANCIKKEDPSICCLQETHLTGLG
jgi:hypothetical protein